MPIRAPTGHKDFQWENAPVTENHIHINEAESTLGKFHSSGTVEKVEKEDEAQRTPGCSGTSSYTDTEHPSYTRGSYGSQEPSWVNHSSSKARREDPGTKKTTANCFR